MDPTLESDVVLRRWRSIKGALGPRTPVGGRTATFAFGVALASCTAMTLGATTTLTGCGERAGSLEPPYPVSIERVSRGARGNNAFPREAVDRAVARGLASNPRFRQAAPGESRALRGSLWFDDREGTDGSRTIELALSVEAPPGLRDPEAEPQLEAFVTLEREAPVADDLAGDLAMALELAVSVVDARVALALGERHRIQSLLEAEDPELVLLALEWTAEHRATDFADAVVSLLAHEDDRVAAAAVETLGVVGSAHHVPAILRHLRLSDSGHAYRAYDALGSLGGPEALAFLRFAARNEDEPDRRIAARRALEQAARQGPEGTVRAETSYTSGGAGPPSTRGHRQ